MERIGVIGGGTMGAGIAEVCARAGATVVVVESAADAVEVAHGRIVKSLDRACGVGG